ncbi:adp-ribosylation factor [Nannochloropsis gaditana]|uniref:Adp-ribosylation factor n=1 Tax=Nannochloropsis gaditana TaxID=72520 RepID=W7U0A7_9STRA|nr:adp-ribosylation factor [Nannochloropsis gaditana]
MGQLCTRLVELVSRRTEKRVVLLGLDNAGKTTCVYRLLLGKKVDTVPTVGFNSEEVRYQRCNFIMWDIGGQAKIRKLWKHYVESADALIFVVDAQDRARLAEARSAFKRMLRYKTLKNTVLLILANKMDYEHAMSSAEIVQGLEVKRVVGRRPWWVQETCAISGQGLREGMDWLLQTLEGHSTDSRGGGSEEGAGEVKKEEEEADIGQDGVPNSSLPAVPTGCVCCGCRRQRRGPNGGSSSEDLRGRRRRRGWRQGEGEEGGEAGKEEAAEPGLSIGRGVGRKTAANRACQGLCAGGRSVLHASRGIEMGGAAGGRKEGGEEREEVKTYLDREHGADFGRETCCG